MSELGEDFKAWDKQKKDKRFQNITYSTKILQQSGVKFDSKNHGVHLIVAGKNGLIDFYPSTGLFMLRKGGQGRGVRNLLKHCEVLATGEGE